MTTSNVPVSVNDQELDDILDSGSQNSFNPVMVTVGIVHQSGKFSIEGMPDQARLSAVIIAGRKTRVEFPKYEKHIQHGSLTGDDLNNEITVFTKKRPFCSSEDGVNGKLADVDWDEAESSKAKDAIKIIKGKIAEGGLKCAMCPLAKWGSVEFFGSNGRGMACKEMRKLLLYRGTPIPMILNVPTSSIRAWDQYCSSLSVANKQYTKVHTELALDIIERSQTKYSVMTFAYLRDIEPELKQELMQPVIDANGIEMPLAKAIINMFLGTGVSLEDYIGDADEKPADDKF